jgi:hypothetical protein
MPGRFLVGGSAIGCILLGGVLIEEPQEEVKLGETHLGEVYRVVISEVIENFIQGKTKNPFDLIRSNKASFGDYFMVHYSQQPTNGWQ